MYRKTISPYGPEHEGMSEEHLLWCVKCSCTYNVFFFPTTVKIRQKARKPQWFGHSHSLSLFTLPDNKIEVIWMRGWKYIMSLKKNHFKIIWPAKEDQIFSHFHLNIKPNMSPIIPAQVSWRNKVRCSQWAQRSKMKLYFVICLLAFGLPPLCQGLF